MRLTPALARRVSFAAVAPLLVGLASSASDLGRTLNDLTSETQRASQDPNRIGLVWWLPIEFWEISMATGPAPSTPEQVSAVTSVLRQYTMFAIADGLVGQFGGVTWFAKEDVRASLLLQDASGTRFAPLTDAQVSPDARNLAAIMKPILSGMLGPMGEHMDFFFFPSKSAEGRLIADAKAEGSFRLQIGEEPYDWRLPLGSLIPKKRCPVDGEQLNGAWKYCPWHGKKLKPASK